MVKIFPGTILTPTYYSSRTEQSTDSGAASGDHLDRSHGRVADHGDHPGLCTSDNSPGDSDRVHYKIGDLGHVAPIFGGEMSPEEVRLAPFIGFYF